MQWNINFYFYNTANLIRYWHQRRQNILKLHLFCWNIDSEQYELKYHFFNQDIPIITWRYRGGACYKLVYLYERKCFKKNTNISVTYRDISYIQRYQNINNKDIPRYQWHAEIPRNRWHSKISVTYRDTKIWVA